MVINPLNGVQWDGCLPFDSLLFVCLNSQVKRVSLSLVFSSTQNETTGTQRLLRGQ